MNAITHFFILIVASCIFIGSGKTPKKVIGGTKEDIENSPHQVSIQYYKQHLCGGSIITNFHVLTAAHCVVHIENEYSMTGLKILSGTSDLKKKKSPAQLHDVVLIISHPSYPSENADSTDDIAMLKIKEPINPSSVRKPISYSYGEEPEDGSIVFFNGWGRDDKGLPSQILLHIKLRVINNERCETISDTNVTPDELCTMHVEGGDLGPGDSGGGLIYKGRIVGVTSTRVQRAAVQIFTRVNFYRPWIDLMIKKY